MYFMCVCEREGEREGGRVEKGYERERERGATMMKGEAMKSRKEEGEESIEMVHVLLLCLRQSPDDEPRALVVLCETERRQEERAFTVRV